MKKILFIINSLGGGGAEKALIEFLRHIDYTRYEVSLCLVFHEGCYLSDVPPEVRVFWLYERERNFVHRKSLKLYRNHGIRTLLRLRARRKIRGHYDAIVSFLEGDALLFHDMVRDRAERNVAWLHCDLRLFHWTRKTFRSDRDEELAYGRMDTIVFCSHITQVGFERMYRIDVPKTVIYNIIDGDSIRRQADAAVVPHDGFTITAVGSLSEVKSHDRLVRVARMFKDAGYRLRFQIVGAGALEEPLKRLRDELGLQDSVRFLGFRKPPYPFMKASDVFVSTSKSEAASLVICEAMTLGVPIVATRTSASEEFLADDRYGIVTGHSDVEIFEGLRRMVDDETLRAHYREQGFKRTELFSAEQTMRQFEALL